MRNTPRNWTAEQTELAEKMWADGFSGTEIGERIDKSRSAVLGFVNRRGLVRADKHRASRLQVLRAPPPPKPPPKPPVVRPVPVKIVPKAPVGRVPEGAKPWLERRAYECQFPVSGDGAYTLSCCAPISDVFGYCAAHKTRMYAAPRPRKTPTEPRRVSLLPK